MTEYRFVNQAEVTINGVDDNEEMGLTDVRRRGGMVRR